MADIVILLDESISMLEMCSSYIQGINNIISTQKQLNPQSRFTLIKFNREVTVVYLDVPIINVPFIDYRKFVPGGITAMYDAIQTAFTLKQDNHPTLLVVMTDGEDTCSKIKPQKLFENIAVYKNVKNWEFLFVGNTQHANEIGHSIGFPTCILYDATPTSINKASLAINIAISQVCTRITGQRNMFSEEKLPLDVRDLTDMIQKMSV